jgi:hypothetical protein
MSAVDGGMLFEALDVGFEAGDDALVPGRLGRPVNTPPRRLVFATDIPRQPETLPRALPPDVDTALPTAVAELNDEFAGTGLTVRARHRSADRGTARPRVGHRRLRTGGQLATSPTGQAQQRTRRAAGPAHPRRPRRLARPPQPAASPATSPRRATRRPRVRRARPPARPDPPPKGAAGALSSPLGSPVPTGNH